MTKSELKQFLTTNGIRPTIYSLEGGLPNDRVCLSGGGDRWTVYYSERGSTFDESVFQTEDAACRELLKRLQALPYDQTH
jgi:hypothetical protein